MEISSNHWLPLTEYALRSGMSISTLRRKIKSNSIEFKMEEGRYLIHRDDLSEGSRGMGFVSTDQAASPRVPSARPFVEAALQPPPPPVCADLPAQSMAASSTSAPATSEIDNLREEVRRLQEDSALRWKALEARVSGIAKKLEFFSEQMAEAKMLVKLFEEKLDHHA